jgi:hypothetical protein
MLIKRNLVKLLCLMLITIGSVAHAFDLEDYATTYRATRDAYLKAANEEKLATGPFLAAANSWIQVEMTEQLAAGNNDAVEYLIKLKSKASSCQ